MNIKNGTFLMILSVLLVMPAFADGNAFTPLNFLVSKDVPADVQKILRDAALKAVKDPEWVKFVNDNCAEKLYEAYPKIEDIKKYYKDWESMVSWMLYDAGVAKYSPEKFGIAKPAN